MSKFAVFFALTFLSIPLLSFAQDEKGFGISDGLEYVSIRAEKSDSIIDGNKENVPLGFVDSLSELGSALRTGNYVCVKLEKQQESEDGVEYQVDKIHSEEPCSVFLAADDDKGYGISDGLEYVSIRGDGGRTNGIDGNKIRFFINTMFNELFKTRKYFCVKLVEFKSPFGFESSYQITHTHNSGKCSAFKSNFIINLAK